MKHRLLATLASVSAVGLAIGAGAAYAAAGSLDPTFGHSGIALTGAIAPPRAMLLLANGDILAASSNGANMAVARYLPNGSLDGTFGTGGVAVAAFPSSLSSGASGLALAPGGKIVAAGGVQPSGASGEFGVARFNANGTLDGSFNGTGMVATPVEPSVGAVGQAALVQPDGKIVVGGAGTVSSYRSATTIGALARYNVNGSLDTTFGSGGTVVGGGLQNISGLGEDAAGNMFVLPSSPSTTPPGRSSRTSRPRRWSPPRPAAMTSSSPTGSRSSREPWAS